MRRKASWPVCNIHVILSGISQEPVCLHDAPLQCGTFRTFQPKIEESTFLQESHIHSRYKCHTHMVLAQEGMSSIQSNITQSDHISQRCHAAPNTLSTWIRVPFGDGPIFDLYDLLRSHCRQHKFRMCYTVQI